MTYALIKNNAVVKYPYTLAQFKADNPEVSLPSSPTTAQLNEQGIYEVIPTPKPQYDWITQGVKEITPKNVGGFWTQSWEVYQLSQQQVAANKEQAKSDNKNTATQLLQSTDWTATVDINNPQYSNPYLGNQDAFLSYRSQIRQIAIDPPVTVAEWPQMPNAMWIPA